ncbi:hypothetical protein KC980_03140 [candidate division WWE3 bacterium]|uniref:Uncharacterized protein n=1 Tax=candidate division WWE3 bacterium TaxID=2053526 RepID=A0A955EBY3_UNCKA|nr:hypothetical protein [candidate division WWE3 bacterium]
MFYSVTHVVGYVSKGCVSFIGILILIAMAYFYFDTSGIKFDPESFIGRFLSNFISQM